MDNPLFHDFFARLGQVIGNDTPSPLHQPEIEGNEWAYVKDCLDSGWVSSVGAYVNRFEDKLVDYTGITHAIATVNGTAALHMCLRLAEVAQGDEVLMPALTFVATANAVSYCGATPHFIDISPATLGVDPKRLDDFLREHTRKRDGLCINRQSGKPIRALIVMHTLGHPAEMDKLSRVCTDYGITLIEDAAESLGSFYRERHTGHWGRLTAFSFNGNKIITTGGGGAILTHDPALAEHARHLTTTAKQPHPWAFVHDEIGYNYRMPNLNAAMGCAQLESLPERLTHKRTLAGKYQQAFTDCELGDMVQEPQNCKSNFWLNAFCLNPAHRGQRDELLEACHAHGILARPLWEPMHHLTMYADCPRMALGVTEEQVQSIICLPSNPALGQTA